MSKVRTIALLDTMWDWRGKTSEANPAYLSLAPRCFRINPLNCSGKRLYKLLGHTNLLCTNVCPQVGNSAKVHGVADAEWTTENLRQLYPFQLLLVCGTVAQKAYDSIPMVGEYRTLFIPHPAARCWSDRAMRIASRFIREGTQDLKLYFHGGGIKASILPPF